MCFFKKQDDKKGCCTGSTVRYGLKNARKRFSEVRPSKIPGNKKGRTALRFFLFVLLYRQDNGESYAGK